MELADRRRRVSAMYLSGKMQIEIAQEIGVTQATVSHDLTALRNQWMASSLRDFDELRAQELAKIDRLEVEYWDAWDRSRRQRTIATQKKSTRPVFQLVDKKQIKTTQEATDVSVRKEDTEGNPAFLAGVQWCIDKRCELLGLNAPRKLAIGDLDAMIEQEMEKRAGRMPNEVTEADGGETIN